MKLRCVIVLTVLVALVGCASQPPPVATCERSWHAEHRGDSLALCVPPGFAGDSVGHLWRRGDAGNPNYLWFTITVRDSAGAAFDWGSTPLPTFASYVRPDTTIPDYVRADSVRSHRDTLAAQVVVTSETALLSGGFVGFYRSPQLRAAWQIPGHRWILVQGFALQPVQLDTLRQILRSVRVQ